VKCFLSHSHKFIFYHIYKTGGTSVKTSLESYFDDCDSDDFERFSKIRSQFVRIPLLRTFVPTVHPSFKNTIDELTRLKIQSYFKFAFVRNPWDWQVSVYHYMLQKRRHRFHQPAKVLGSFNNYVHYLNLRGQLGKPTPNQIDFISDRSGKIQMDFVGRFENFENDFNRITSHVGISANLCHVNRGNRNQYREYYTPRSRRIVSDLYQRDIEIFGYRF